jgi:glyoxylase-like metal-dependent hydrolase (beta-lactamase superfamily II)
VFFQLPILPKHEEEIVEGANARTEPTALRPEITRITSRMFAVNTYIFRWPDRTDCVVIDPGFDVDRILQRLFDTRLTPAAILNTHGHIDHITGNAALKRQWPSCPLAIGEHEVDKLTDPMLNLSGLYGTPVVSPPADLRLRADERFVFAGLEFTTRLTPGHSSGHVVFLWQGSPPWILFGGDVLFAGSVGRTDFPDGSFEQLRASIREQLFTLPDDTVVLPGHGGPTTIGQERRDNPFVGENCD